MSVIKLNNASYLANDWQDETKSKNDLKKGHITLYVDTVNKLVKNGSSIDLNGSIYQVTSDTTITNDPTSGEYYLYLRDIDDTIDFLLDATVPSFDYLKNGYYNNMYRAIGFVSIVDSVWTWENTEILLDGTKCKNLNADKLDGYTTGNSSGNIPLSNGVVNTNLNAEMIQGLKLTEGKAGTYGSIGIGASGSWIVPKGIYCFANGASQLHFQIKNDSSSWIGNGSINGLVISDGVNYRINNTATGTITVSYRKIM